MSSSLQTTVLTLMHDHGLTKADVMMTSGISETILSLWLNDKYQPVIQPDNQSNKRSRSTRSSIGQQQLIPDLSMVNDRLLKWTTMMQQGGELVDRLFKKSNEQPNDNQTKRNSVKRIANQSIVPITFQIISSHPPVTQSIKQTIMWDLLDTSLTPLMFAKSYVYENSIDYTVAPIIAEQIERSINQSMQVAEEQIRIHNASSDQSQLISQPPSHLINQLLHLSLDLTLNGIRLLDEFIWDPSNHQSSPEQYAETMVGDLGLSMEWIAVVSAEVRRLVELAVNEQNKQFINQSDHQSNQQIKPTTEQSTEEPIISRQPGNWYRWISKSDDQTSPSPSDQPVTRTNKRARKATTQQINQTISQTENQSNNQTTNQTKSPTSTTDPIYQLPRWQPVVIKLYDPSMMGALNDPAYPFIQPSNLFERESTDISSNRSVGHSSNRSVASSG